MKKGEKNLISVHGTDLKNLEEDLICLFKQLYFILFSFFTPIFVFQKENLLARYSNRESGLNILEAGEKIGNMVPRGGRKWLKLFRMLIESYET